MRSTSSTLSSSCAVSPSLPREGSKEPHISKGVGRGTTYPSLPTKDLIGDLRSRLRVETNTRRGRHISDGWSLLRSLCSSVRPRSDTPVRCPLSGPSDGTVRAIDERRHPYPPCRSTVNHRGVSPRLGRPRTSTVRTGPTTHSGLFSLSARISKPAPTGISGDLNVW